MGTDERFHSPGAAFSAQAAEEAKLQLLMSKAATSALASIKKQALSYSLTSAYARETYAKAVDNALTEFGVDPASTLGIQLRIGLQADSFGDEAYDSVQKVFGLRAGMTQTLSSDQLEEALNEALGLSTGTLVAAGARRIPWLSKLLARSGKLGMKWSDRVSRDVRTAYTGYSGALAQRYFDKNNIPKKKWVTRHDTKVRPSHAAADGQVVPRNGFFVVGSAQLPFPGAPDGPLDEVINCRCVTIVADEE